jgi:hypothetical protein
VIGCVRTDMGAKVGVSRRTLAKKSDGRLSKHHDFVEFSGVFGAVFARRVSLSVVRWLSPEYLSWSPFLMRPMFVRQTMAVAFLVARRIDPPPRAAGLRDPSPMLQRTPHL